MIGLKSVGGSCGCSLRTLAHACDCHETTAKKYLVRLVEHGFVRESVSKARTWRSIIPSNDAGQIEVLNADPMLAVLCALVEPTGRCAIERSTLRVFCGHIGDGTLNRHLDRVRASGLARIGRSKFMEIELVSPVIPFRQNSPKNEASPFADF